MSPLVVGTHVAGAGQRRQGALQLAIQLVNTRRATRRLRSGSLRTNQRHSWNKGRWRYQSMSSPSAGGHPRPALQGHAADRKVCARSRDTRV